FSPLPMAVQGRLKPLAFAVHGTDTRVGGNALYELIAQLVGQRHPHELTPAQLDAIEQLYIGTLQWLDQQPGLAKDDLLPVRLRLALGRFYKTHYHHNQALSELSAVFTSLSKHPSPPPDLMAATASAIGGIHAYRQHWPSAVKAFRQALRYTPDSNPQKADHAFQLALCFEGMGQLKLAIEAYHDSYKLALDQQNPVACAAALYNLGCLYWDHQAFKKAKTIFEKCLIFDEQHDAAKTLCRTLMMASKACEAVGDHQGAIGHAQQALTVAQTSESIQFRLDPDARQLLTASACLRLGYLAERSKDRHAALQYFTQARHAGESTLSPDSLVQLDDKIAAYS
ncbi:MAG: tetratricopeptide repeat protein, partial [Cyanobacteria bacterium HKST-UBA03]|nr:tetratricopeptide repeat protein [Cyanobacteria bacterium HKST-UBA03]